MFHRLLSWFRLRLDRHPDFDRSAVNGHMGSSSSRHIRGTRCDSCGAPLNAHQQSRTPPPHIAKIRRFSDDRLSEYLQATRQIASAWPTLPPHIRETILTLVDAGQRRSNGDPL